MSEIRISKESKWYFALTNRTSSELLKIFNQWYLKIFKTDIVSIQTYLLPVSVFP